MFNVVKLIFNLFQENIYIVYDEMGECIIFDLGCNSLVEEQELVKIIDDLGLKFVWFINIYCYIDYVFGN